MRCSKCGTDNREGARFCDKCGGKFSPRCASCGAENRTDAKFCDSCGAALGAEATGAAPGAKINDTPIRVAEISAAENLEGERKTHTALFADIKGSTELQQDLDPEESRTIIDPALKIMIDAARRYDGYVQSTGDGIFALFGAPLAHEDHPQRAVHAALRMQREIRRYGDQLLEAGGVPIEIRVGVNTGEVVMRPLKTGDSHIEYAPIGHTTNLASRMQAVARSGSVVVSEATRKLVEGYFQLKSIGPTRVKGVNEPVHVYEVTGLGPLRTRLQRSASRGYTKFVGRQREMETMEQAAELAKTGHGQIVAAVAEPGVGKSRLLYEFKAKHQSGWIVLEALSVSHGKASAYLPMIDLLHGYFGIRADDDQRTRREKVNGRIVTLDPDLEDTRAYLFGLLGLGEGDDPLAGMDAQIRRQRTLEALKRILLRESLNQPLMVVFEDLHWIDDETQAFLNLLADSIDSAKVLLAVNYRPEYSHQWGSKSYYTELRLDPLGGESAQEMLSSLLGDGSELSPLKGLILGKTEGNPLFMEEIVQALYEEGTLAHDGAAHLTRPLDALKVPTSVQAVLAARIDRLPAKQKESLQMLAVVGTEFPLSLVRAMSERASESELDRTLEQLQLADFIYEQPAAGDIEYTFKHALTQEVAYNSVLHERRKALHERIGAAIESLYADSLDDHVAELARHYGRSNRGAKAAHYLHLAAIQAQQRGAFGDAVALTRRGLTALETMGAGPERDRLEIPLQLMLGQCLGPVLSPTSSELAEAYARAIELAERVGDQGQLFAALTGRATYFVMTGDVAGMQGIDQLLLTMAKQSRNPAMLGTAHAICASSCLWSGDLAGAKMHGVSGPDPDFIGAP